MKKRSVKDNNLLGIISTIIILISIIITMIFMFSINNVLPVKYMLIIGVFLIVFYILFTLFNYRWKNKKTLIIFNIISVVLIILELFAIFKIGDTVNFLNKNLTNKNNTMVYNLVVKKDSLLNDANDCKNLSIMYYKDLEDDSKLLEKVKELKLVNYTENVYDMLSSVVEEEKVALVSSAYFEAMLDIDEEYDNKTKIIATYEIEYKKEKVEASNVEVSKAPFLLFINGIDTRSGKLPARSLSDVNILMAVNPKTKEVLMTAIPRDYYVQLHGTNGLKDKLTHSGTYGGVNSTISTIEDLFGMKIDYYVRLNFNSVVNLVDAIGGITINSDVDYSFNCHTNKSCTINPGSNKLDGACALAFARERKAYTTGDKHRGENQEQVISAVLTKVTSSKTLINNYSKILDAVDGTFESSLSTDDITSMIKMQIDTMSKWTVNTYNLNGTSGMDYTRAYPNQKLSIMYPDYSTLTTAKNKLKKVLNQ